jgi:uncharacterized protein (TIGR00730 family)
MTGSSVPSVGRDPRTIAVFGSAEPLPGSADYDRAYRVGRQLAEAGFNVITGGYGGVMEAASSGARDGGGRAVGVACAVFADRETNPYLDQVIRAPDLMLRTRELIDGAAGFVVLPGKAGTLSELAQLWALERAGCLAGRPVILLGRHWKALLSALDESGMLETSQLQITRVVDRPRDVVRVLVESAADAET